MKKAKKLQNYWVKPLALHHTKLRGVILIDGDAVLMRDPVVFRTLSGYERTGTTFFHDRVSKVNQFLSKKDGRSCEKYLLDIFPHKEVGLSGPKPSDLL